MGCDAPRCKGNNLREELIPVGTFLAKGIPSRQVKNQFYTSILAQGVLGIIF